MEATDSAKAEHQAGPDRPAHEMRQSHAECGGNDDLGNRAWDGDPLHLQQVVEREMQADAEHQQDNADLGQLIGDFLIGHVAGRERSDQDAGDQVAYERRYAQALRKGPKHKGEHETGDKGGEQRRVMMHRSCLSR